MKILIINPNSDKNMCQAILNSARDYVDGDYQVECLPTPGAPVFIETYEDQIKSAPGMIKLIRENENKFDAFILACHCDPQLDVLKEVSKKPVVGIGEASVKIASMLGHSFSIISTDLHSVPNKIALVKKYNLLNSMASVKAPDEEMKKLDDKTKYLTLARKALDEDQAEVIVLGCAGMAGIDKYLQKALKVPVLDGTICALIIAAGMVKYNVSISKARRYNPIY